MGFLDKIKGAVNAVTGNAAKVEIEFMPMAMAGDKLAVRVRATSTGQKVDSKGVFIDLSGTEKILIRRGQATGVDHDVNVQKTTFEKEINIAPAFSLAPNETKSWEATIEIPMGLQPSYQGAYTKHEVYVRGRIEAMGNDPDSGFLPLMLGVKPGQKPA